MLIWIAAALLALIAIAHSALGEKLIVGPLLAARELPVAIPRAAARRVIRFAWHLTSLAWLGLAAVLVGVPPAAGFAAVCLVSFLVIVVMLPGHVAWPLFLAAGALALGSAGWLPDALLWAVIGGAVLVALAASVAHAAWAFGVRRGTANVIPQRPDGSEPLFHPQGPLTLVIAAALAFYAVLVVWVGLGRGGPWGIGLTIAAAVILAVRVMGDGHWVGVTKTVRNTGFARADDRYWTPAAALLALGAGAALALAF